ncbi:hypothetical protein [Zavarzinella formosa]|nr:hypothetical protein [Zavarzinella formosa]
MNTEILNGLQWFGLGIGIVMVLAVLEHLMRTLTNYGTRQA